MSTNVHIAVKQDLGAQFESGASKRKRKVELELKILELSGSLLNFLKGIMLLL